MVKFIQKVLFIFWPLILLQAYTLSYYSPDKGDLLRIGYLIDRFPDYRSIFKKEFEQEMKVISFSEISKNDEYDILTLGDSFSEQNNYGYQNQLALNYGLKVVHLDRYYYKNQIQALIGLVNSEFFDVYEFRYVLIEFIEGGTNQLSNVINTEYTYPSINFEKRPEINNENYTKRFVFPSDRLVKFPYYSIKSVIAPYQDSNQVYSLTLQKEMFSVNDDGLFFHSSNPDLINNNDQDEVKLLNDLLNYLSDRLEKKGVKLIAMPVPDKLDFYFDFVNNPGKFQKTQFFKIMEPLEKKFIYLDSYKLLKDEGDGLKDIYFYDDSHWSPRGAKIVGDGINNLIKSY